MYKDLRGSSNKNLICNSTTWPGHVHGYKMPNLVFFQISHISLHLLIYASWCLARLRQAFSSHIISRTLWRSTMFLLVLVRVSLEFGLDTFTCLISKLKHSISIAPLRTHHTKPQHGIITCHIPAVRSAGCAAEFLVRVAIWGTQARAVTIQVSARCCNTNGLAGSGSNHPGLCKALQYKRISMALEKLCNETEWLT